MLDFRMGKIPPAVNTFGKHAFNELACMWDPEPLPELS
jgi:hypothetical protein